MDKKNVIIESGKNLLISTLEITEINFLMAIQGLKPEMISKRAHEGINHLAWIIGHCISHMDSYLSFFSNERKLSKEQREYHAYGVSKERVIDYSFSFSETMENYLQISKEFFSKLHELPEEVFYSKTIPDVDEYLFQMIQRITLHIMGHTGQIVLIRRMLGDTPFSFVGGITKESREKLKKKWLKWWIENKEKLI